jgi:hypothetical protein
VESKRIVKAALAALGFAACVWFATGSNAGAGPTLPEREDTFTWFDHLGSRTMAQWPEEFAGLRYREPGSPLGGVEVMFSKGAREKVAQIASDSPDPELLIPLDVPKSHAEMTRDMAEVIEDRELAKDGRGPLSGAARGMFDLDADLRSGEILVLMPKPDQETQGIFQRQYPYKFRFVESALGEFGACVARDDCNDPLRAGVQARNSMTPYNEKRCSTGFTVLYSGVRHLLSAAHCSMVRNTLPSPLERRWNGPTNTAFGRVIENHLYGPVDVELIELLNGFGTVPFVYRANDTKTWEVTAQHVWADFTIGMQACRSGNTSGYSCGFVEGVYFSPTRFIGTASKYIRTDACSSNGDSGGPWYRGTIAAGIHAGWIDNDNDPDCSGEPMQSYFGTIDAALDAVDATLVYSP